MLTPAKGKWLLKRYQADASVTFTMGDLVSLSAGELVTATAQSTKHIGIIMESITSGDSDFATGRKVSVAIPSGGQDATFYATVTGTLATTDVGVTFDMSTAGLVNKAGTTYDVVTCVGFLTTAKGEFILNSDQAYADPNWE